MFSFSYDYKKYIKINIMRCKKVAARYFANNNIKGAPVAIDLVKSTYSIEEDATVISFNGRGL